MSMIELDLGGDAFTDKVLGCWIGKNAGGTLGTPVEEAWGKPEPFDIWWYPELQSGGLPNDDLEMQLVWLTALEQVGPELKAADLARYWLAHIGYNFDEYGLNKANLRLGLEPPVSGAWNNWFVDCMGCPIRSEVWACIAPGVPRVAARYAYQDAICDHAGGESVFGELFNVAIQSSAFVVSDRQRLLDIGLSYVPPESATYAAITAARRAHADGLDWKQARQRVLEATPSLIAQYSPINLGFQVIGLLYSEDFGESMCITVNCGYDTDSSGGSIGSWLGIRAGMSKLPTPWIEPFGYGLSTNESWGGVRHLTDGSTPIPTDILQLTEKVREQAERVLRHHRLPVGDDGRIAVDEESLYVDDAVRALWTRSPWQVRHDRRHLQVTVDYDGTAAAAPGTRRTIAVELHNPYPDPVTVDVSMITPHGWKAPAPTTVSLGAAGSTSVELEIGVGDRVDLQQRNVVLVTAQPRGYPTVAPVSVPLVGAQAWRHRALAADEQLTAGAGADDAEWQQLVVEGNELPLADLLAASDRVGLQTFVEAAEELEVRLAVDTSINTRVQVNGTVVIDYTGPRHIRPSYGAAEEGNQVVRLQPGFNEILIEAARVDAGAADGDHTIAGHFFMSTPDKLRNGIVHLGRTRFPWD